MKKPDSHYIKLIINNIIRDEKNCWVWQRAINKSGYGNTCYNGAQIGVHVLVKKLFNEHVKGLVCDHMCKNTACCNPDHIRMVTNRFNILNKDSNNPAAKNLRKTHCKYGHPFNEQNTRFYKQKVRAADGTITHSMRKICITCYTEKNKRYREKKKCR